MLYFFFNDTATTEIYTLSLHDALPIYVLYGPMLSERFLQGWEKWLGEVQPHHTVHGATGRITSANPREGFVGDPEDRKSTRLNSSHANISYAVFCLKKKKAPGNRSPIF